MRIRDQQQQVAAAKELSETCIAAIYLSGSILAVGRVGAPAPVSEATTEE
jgi:hypothetical protein